MTGTHKGIPMCRLLNLLTALSLLLCLAVVALWVQSLDPGQSVRAARRSGSSWNVVSQLGSLAIRYHYPSDEDRPLTWSVREVPHPPHALVRPTASSGWGIGRVRFERGTGRLFMNYPIDGISYDRGLVTFSSVECPYSAMAAALGATTTTLVVPRMLWRLRRARRSRAGLCPTCGFDLRASPGRCPECGKAVISGRVA
jgi:hypothetical protein